MGREGSEDRQQAQPPRTSETNAVKNDAGIPSPSISCDGMSKYSGMRSVIQNSTVTIRFIEE